jgi:S-DNA-T family DNA segregation ATPase FtsK/SpoIIIE
MSAQAFVPRRASPEPAATPRAEAPRDASEPEATPSRVPYAREASALLLLVAALYTTLALGSYEADPFRPEVTGPDWVGPVGAMLAGALTGSVGIAAWFVPFELGLLAAPLLAGRRTQVGVARVAGDVVVVVVLAALCQVLMPTSKAFGAVALGGGVGELFGELLRQLFSTIGSLLIGVTIVLLILIGRAELSIIEWAARIRRWGERLEGFLGRRFASLVRAWDEAREHEGDAPAPPSEPTTPGTAEALVRALADEVEEPMAKPAPLSLAPALALEADALFESFADATPPPPAVAQRGRAAELARGKRPSRRAPAPPEVPTPSPIPPSTPSAPPSTPSVRPKQAGRSSLEPQSLDLQPLEHQSFGDATSSGRPSRAARPLRDVEQQASSEPTPAPPTRRAPPSDEAALRIVDTSAALVAEKAELPRQPQRGGFRLPSLELLDPPKASKHPIDEARLKETADLLEKVLADYGVSGKVEQVQPGPTVTTFEVSPQAGTKVSKVASLADDLALGLSRKVRIIAPIPGKNRIGFEVPNEHRMPVCLRELVEDRRFLEMTDPLPVVIGRDIIGAPFYADISSMPHVIVAGATGAGKSVGLNVMLVSLLFRRTPSELRLLMIDPKVVELAPFDGIPHMLLPVVTDMKQASNAMKWAVDEMERRYQLFANAGTRNISSYNGWVERIERGELPKPKPAGKVSAIAADGTEVEVDAAKDGADADVPEKLPYIVIVIDEFADLMMQQGKDVEASVARIAQKARAAGMHVILATQRPSVDVITGMIKANFPSRIAFRVAQKVDSRTILDEQGAEHLLGRGDMLLRLNGQTDTRRVQGPFCTEEEVQRACDYLRSQGRPVYDESILRPRDEEGAPIEEDAELDAKYDEAVRVVAETRKCSVSWLQRKLGIGYNRAAKIVETMEARGVVGPQSGSKEREVLISAL